MSRLSPEEELQLIADVEAARDDPDAPLVSVPLEVAEDAGVSLTVKLSFETFIRLDRAAKANDLPLGEVITRALDAFEAAAAPPEDVPEASPPPQRRRKSAKAS